MNVMNSICFGRTTAVPEPLVDGNFISIYNAKTGRFHYFCHRLNNIEIENAENPAKGKMWVVFINGKKENWDLLVENNYKIYLKRGVKILWKF